MKTEKQMRDSFERAYDRVVMYEFEIINLW